MNIDDNANSSVRFASELSERNNYRSAAEASAGRHAAALV